MKMDRESLLAYAHRHMLTLHYPGSISKHSLLTLCGFSSPKGQDFRSTGRLVEVEEAGKLGVTKSVFVCLCRSTEQNNIIPELQPGVSKKSCSIYCLFAVHLQSLDLLSMSTTDSTETRRRTKFSNTICHLSPSQNYTSETLSNIYFFCLIELWAPPGTI